MVMDLHKTYKITSILSILLSMASFVSGSITLHFNFNLSNLMLLIYYTPLIITTCLAEFKHWIILTRIEFLDTYLGKNILHFIIGTLWIGLSFQSLFINPFIILHSFFGFFLEYKSRQNVKKTYSDHPQPPTIPAPQS